MAVAVFDASIAAAWCFPDEQTAYAKATLDVLANGAAVLVPGLWAYEIRNSVLIGVRRRRISEVHGDDFLAMLAGFLIGLRRPVSHDAVFAVAKQYQLTVYDAAYLDLAIREALPLASLDALLTRAATTAGVALFQA
ncbi:type II toxin-antitoxin system VapC family toxin [Nevskia soli]|uniref:type II toxin-antitoxin system VapC family toxin n=1 Tax=Nevskia soli TaxID=418856 RepID=UPI0015D7AEE7|nr:type II toxin-antitoxin system VapC family toxin [Nevskia soli]